ncbi:Craniofacial development protein 2 [Eumeta japonica]|uniref:Craniofacial development protein 2 n=1 Tax=Eumeta variegata TaxID=151549 RepID=A0A4C1V9Q2_EUMVA|nr:Craniofacial development protein 2 [Eumeta japonica]
MPPDHRNQMTNTATINYIHKQSTKCLPPRLVPAEDLDHHPLTRIKNKRNENKLYIATLNTRTLRTPESLSDLEEALKDLKWDILEISEMRRTGEYIEEHQDFILFNKGVIEEQGGVGFIVKKYLKEHIIEFIGINDRTAILNIILPSFKKTWTIIQVFAPTEQADEFKHESFYNDLSQAIISNYSKNIIILMGVFNAQVGIKQCKEDVLGHFGYGKRSKNGQRLVEFLLEHNLTLLNSILRKTTSGPGSLQAEIIETK